MSDLTGSTISTTYNLLLTTESAVMGSSLQSIQSGTGVSSALKLSTTDVSVNGSLGVGLSGTDTPDTQLHVFNSATHAVARLEIDSSLTTKDINLEFKNNDGTGYLFQKSTANDSALVLRPIAGKDLLLVDTGGGNVGIGGTPTQGKLHVFGNICIDSTAGASDILYSQTAAILSRHRTTNAVIIQSAGGDVSLRDSGGTDRLIVDNATGNVGTPNAFHVTNGGSHTAGNAIYSPASNEMGISTNAVERIRIDSSGNVGIGDSPATDTRFEVKDNGELAFKGNDGNSELYIKNNTGIESMAGTASLLFAQGLNSNGGKIVSGRDENYETSAERSSYMAFYTSLDAYDTERMRIDSAGNVGIGTDGAPATSLHVSGAYDSGVTPYIRAEDTTSTGALIDIYASQATGAGYVQTGAATHLRFAPAGSTKMILEYGGNVGIGVTPNTEWWAQDTALQLGGTATFGSNTVAGAGNELLIGVNTVQRATTDNYLVEDEASRYKQQHGTHAWQYAASGAADAAITWSTGLSQDASGNVGIGASTVQAKLDVSTGGQNADAGYNAQNAALNLIYEGGPDTDDEGQGVFFSQQYSTADPTSYVRTGAVLGYKQTADGSFGGGLKFKIQPTGATAMTEAMRIDSSGNVIVASIPTSDPSIAGALWSDSGTVKISAG